MSTAPIRRFIDANAYADHVTECLRGDMIPIPPSTAEELLVITEEHPHLVSAFLPLMFGDTDTARAAVELIAEISDWL